MINLLIYKGKLYRVQYILMIRLVVRKASYICYQQVITSTCNLQVSFSTYKFGAIINIKMFNLAVWIRHWDPAREKTTYCETFFVENNFDFYFHWDIVLKTWFSIKKVAFPMVTFVGSPVLRDKNRRFFSLFFLVNFANQQFNFCWRKVFDGTWALSTRVGFPMVIQISKKSL